jgi:hypothetical protein
MIALGCSLWRVARNDDATPSGAVGAPAPSAARVA